MPESKRCTKCGEEKLLTEFTRQRSRKDGFTDHCKDCLRKEKADYYQRRKEHIKAQTKRNRQSKPEHYRQLDLLKKFGMTLVDYEAMLKGQDGACAVCRSKEALGRWNGHFHVDHDHETGAVRGLLCGRCNVGLGNFQDNPDLLRKAAAYLEKHHGS